MFSRFWGSRSPRNPKIFGIPKSSESRPDLEKILSRFRLDTLGIFSHSRTKNSFAPSWPEILGIPHNPIIVFKVYVCAKFGYVSTDKLESTFSVKGLIASPRRILPEEQKEVGKYRVGFTSIRVTRVSKRSQMLRSTFIRMDGEDLCRSKNISVTLL